MLDFLFNKVAGLRPANLLKRYSSTGDFQRALRNFENNYLQMAASLFGHLIPQK